MRYRMMHVASAVMLSLSAAAQTRPARTLSRESRVRSPETLDVAFELEPPPAGQQVRLSLRARVDWPGLAGFNPWTIIRVNGNALGGRDLLNKPAEFTTRNGVEFVWVKSSRWTVLYSPDFSDAVRTRIMPWGFPDTDPYTFVWDVTPYVWAGANTVAFTHVKLLAEGTTLVLKDVMVECGAPVESLNRTARVAPAPTGDLPAYVASGRQGVPMDVSISDGGSLRLSVEGHTLDLRSQTSEANGEWCTTADGAWKPVLPNGVGKAQWQGSAVRIARRVTVRRDHVHVADTIANTSGELVGVIYQSRMRLTGPAKPEILLGGRPPCSPHGSENPAHPSAIALWDDLALGLFAEDDVFRVHVRCLADEQAVTLSDPRLGIAPGESHTLEWSVYPVPNGDYWDVINAVRRNWGCNIAIPGPGLFDHATDGGMSQGRFDDMVHSRRLKLAFTGQTAFIGSEVETHGGEHKVDLAEGTAIPLAAEWGARTRQWVAKLHAADPRVRTLVYLHPAICTEPGAETKYADCRLLDRDGKHVTSPYRYPVYEYLATLDNAYGRALFGTVEWILREIAPDGIYMDEISRGSVPQYAYHAQWDGCTVEIDQQTHAVEGRMSSVVLLGQPWKTELVRLLRERGGLLVGNSPCYTRTMVDWRMPMFAETGSYSFLRDMHLSTPWGLGNHDNANNDRARSTMVRKALEHGCAITVYSWGDRPEGLHYMHVMYPITPQELRPAMILGRERIVTTRSGRYGWPDRRAGGTVTYVFDGEGKPVADPMVKTVHQAARTLTEVRMPSDHFAVLVRAEAETDDR